MKINKKRCGDSQFFIYLEQIIVFLMFLLALVTILFSRCQQYNNIDESKQLKILKYEIK